MRKYLILFLFIPSILFGQSYFDNNPIWSVHSGCGAWGSCGMGPPCIEYRDYNYYFKGDTSFNSHSYKKLFIKGADWHTWDDVPPIPPCCQSGYTFNDTVNAIAFLRDSLNKIFIVDSSASTEMLLYDFNLSIGDTLPITYNNNDSTITVVAIDSIPISNFYRKRFRLSGNQTPNYLIEGIGHDWGFLEMMNPILECGGYLACFGLGDTAYYPSLRTTCDLHVGIGKNEKDISTIKIFPNPFNAKLNIIKKENQPSEIILYDIASRKLIQQKFTNSVSLNTSQLASGLYFYEVRNKNGVVAKGKVVKE